ncbi:MAG: ATP-grasp domain-containing protein [Methylococcales bacterium]|nr:ATP-grasp domain-containing protein [Methylococcales bacterium]
MKILVFEYICGGGFSSKKIAPTLAKEGLLMLKTLVNELAESGEHQLSILIDKRFIAYFDKSLQFILVHRECNLLATFQKRLSHVDAVWIIAPETEQILYTFTQLVQFSNKILLSSPCSAIKKTADKWQTFHHLSTHKIITIDTVLVKKNATAFPQKTVLKIRDGVGCENNFMLQNQQALTLKIAQLDHLENYILQPFMEGKKLSLSALFKQGKSQFICANHQNISINNQQFKLLSCRINAEPEQDQFQLLLDKIAQAFPTLWGYVGIDLIQQAQQLIVVEINPRLTTSYVGIKPALGINLAAEVLRLIYFDLRRPSPSNNQSVLISIP